MTASNSNELKIRFHGVRGSIPSPSPANLRYGGNTSCVELRLRDQLLILDAGSGIRSLGNELVQTAGDRPIEATLLLSHAHWDHIQGLPFFSPGYSVRNRINIFSAIGRGVHLQRALANQMSPPHFPVRIDEMGGLTMVGELAPDLTQLGDFSVRATALNHPGGCSGFRIETSAGTIAYLPDHEPFRNDNHRPGAAAYRELVQFVRDLDLLILDTQYTADEYQNRAGWGHGCLPASVELAIEAGVRRLFLFHHDPSHSDQQIDQMVETARALATGSSLIINAASENEPMSLVRSSFDHGSEIGMTGPRPWQYPSSEKGAAFTGEPLHQRH